MANVQIVTDRTSCVRCSLDSRCCDSQHLLARVAQVPCDSQRLLAGAAQVQLLIFLK